MQDKIEELEQKLKEMTEAFVDEQDENRELRETIDDLNREVTNLEEDVEEYEEQIKFGDISPQRIIESLSEEILQIKSTGVPFKLGMKYHKDIILIVK